MIPWLLPTKVHFYANLIDLKRQSESVKENIRRQVHEFETVRLILASFQ
jgi:hypothetical protein